MFLVSLVRVVLPMELLVSSGFVMLRRMEVDVRQGGGFHDALGSTFMKYSMATKERPYFFSLKGAIVLASIG